MEGASSLAQNWPINFVLKLDVLVAICSRKQVPDHSVDLLCVLDGGLFQVFYTRLNEKEFVNEARGLVVHCHLDECLAAVDPVHKDRTVHWIPSRTTQAN